MRGTAGLAMVRPVYRWLDQVGQAALMGVHILRILPYPRRYLTAALAQAYAMGIRSLPLVLIMAVLGGAVTSQQTGLQFSGALPLWVVGSVAGAGVITELGPVLTGMVLIGRIGAAIAAELASMKVTEQIDALIAMDRDPIAFLVVPRVVAGVIVVPPLVVLAIAAGILSSWLVALLAMPGLTTADFVYGMRFYFHAGALFYAVIKAAAFGLTITFLACFIGLEGRGGAEGVGRTTTTAVVAITLALMTLDVALVPLLKMMP